MWPGTGNPENNLTAGCSDSEFIVMYVLPPARQLLSSNGRIGDNPT